MLIRNAIEFDNESFVMNGIYGKVMYIDNYPKTLESDILTSMSRSIVPAMSL